MELLTTEFIAEDGTRYLRTGGNPCWRFYNPGNIRPSDTSVCDALKIGIGKTKNGKFMILPDYETGWRALKLLLKVTYKRFTVNEIAEVYSPETDKNDPEKYTYFIIHEANVNGNDRIEDMEDSTLERVMEAIKKMEGYYNKKDTQKEKTIPTTNITISDGNKPVENEKVKVVIDQCTYDWNTNKYGEIPVIAHLPGRNKIDILVLNVEGKDENIYSTSAGTTSQSILLLKSGQTFTAKTGEHKEGEKTTEDYIVKKGDNLSKIARELHTTVKRLADLNGITNINVISVGQKLKVPGGVSKPQVVQPQGNQQQVSTGTSDNGYPQANVGNSIEQAPWMAIAIREAKQWHGTGEANIGDNYHILSGSSGTLHGTAWCASFVTYCLNGANYHHALANTRSSQFPVNESGKFYEISEPVYGAIMVLKNYSDSTNKDTKTGHITFVYGKTSSGAIAALGGNQGGSRFCGGTIKLSEYPLTGITAKFEGKHQKFYKFYLPVGYVANNHDLMVVDVDSENATVFGIALQSSNNEGGGL
jgi:uncharacterized protein (TIGR02594 family)